MHWHRLSPPNSSPIPSLPKTLPSRSRSGGGIGHSPTTNRYRKEYRIEWAKVSKTRFHECTCAILRFWPFWAFHTIIMGDSKDARTTHSERYATPPRRHSTRQALHLVFMARTSSPQHALSPHNNTRSSQHGMTHTHEMEESNTQESLMDTNLAGRRGYSSMDGDSIANSTLDSPSTPSSSVKSAITPSFS